MKPGIGAGLLIVTAIALLGLSYLYSGDWMAIFSDAADWISRIVGFEEY